MKEPQAELSDEMRHADIPYDEAPYRVADYKEAMTEVIRICKRAMNKTVGPPWVALDKINRIASRQLLLTNTPLLK